MRPGGIQEFSEGDRLPAPAKPTPVNWWAVLYGPPNSLSRFYSRPRGPLLTASLFLFELVGGNKHGKNY